MSVFFYSDTHFDDEGIILYEQRPFENSNEMNEAQIKNWNNIVSDEDTVYVLGDIGNPEYIRKLNGHKFLIKGNHDEESNAYYRKIGFDEVYDKPIILDGFWFLSHEPMYMTTQAPFANIFGHVHSNPMYKIISPVSYCVCGENIGYTPISFDEIKEALLKERNKMHRQNKKMSDGSDTAK